MNFEVGRRFPVLGCDPLQQFDQPRPQYNRRTQPGDAGGFSLSDSSQQAQVWTAGGVHSPCPLHLLEQTGRHGEGELSQALC